MPSYEVATADINPFGWTQAKLLKPGDQITGAGCGVSTVTSNRREEHPEGVLVYNLEIEGTHSFFVRAEGSDAEPVWVHNASYPGAHLNATEVGIANARRAEYWWGGLSDAAAENATVAVSRVGNQEIVSLYGNIGKGISAREVAAFKQGVQDAGGIPIFTSGDVHAEVALYQAFPGVDAIGISNPKGPCDALCRLYFSQADVQYYNLFWRSPSER